MSDRVDLLLGAPFLARYRYLGLIGIGKVSGAAMRAIDAGFNLSSGATTTRSSRIVGSARKLPLGQDVGQSTKRFEVELFTT